MTRILNTLRHIERSLDELGNTIRREGEVARRELEERERLGLEGEAAIKHYNEWMERYGMYDLMVKEGLE